MIADFTAPPWASTATTETSDWNTNSLTHSSAKLAILRDRSSSRERCGARSAVNERLSSDRCDGSKSRLGEVTTIGGMVLHLVHSALLSRDKLPVCRSGGLGLARIAQCTRHPRN